MFAHLRTDQQRRYNILRPIPTHFRKVTCSEADCQNYKNGWKTRLPAGDADMLSLARNSGRKYQEFRLDDGFIEFFFEPGQPCFKAAFHRVPIERPAIHVVRDGVKDPRKLSAQSWRDDLGEHLDRIRSAQERG